MLKIFLYLLVTNYLILEYNKKTRMHWIWKSHSFRIYARRSAGVSLSEVYSRLRTTIILFPALLFPSQWNDQYCPDRHHLNSASDEHGQILEGSARDMRHPEDSRGTHSVHPVQTTATAGRSNLSPVDSTAQTCPKQVRQEVNSVDSVSFVIWLTFEEVNSDFVSFVVELTFGQSGLMSFAGELFILFTWAFWLDVDSVCWIVKQKIPSPV